jgi:glycosyltransferase involved in cell wall biosynthesis
VRILDVGPWIAYPPRRGRAARAHNLLLELAAQHDVRHFGRGLRPLVSRGPLLEEVPVTPMFRVVRCRYPLGGRAAEWLSGREPSGDLAETVARRAAAPRRFRELLEWADVVVAEDPVELALCRRERPTSRLVFVAHDVGDPAAVSPSGHDRAAEAVAAAMLTIALSPADRDVLLERYALDPERVAVVPNGVDPGRHLPAEPAVKDELRRELGLPSGRLVVFAGGKSPAGLAGVAWVRRLAAAVPGSTFLVAGAAARPERSERFVATGPVGDVAPYLRAADVALCPLERRGGTPLGLLEPLACELPVVAFAEALRGTELRDGEHVLVAEKGERAVVAALERLGEDVELARRLAAAGRAHVLGCHTWSRSASLLAEALARLLEPRGGGAASNGPAATAPVQPEPIPPGLRAS